MSSQTELNESVYADGKTVLNPQVAGSETVLNEEVAGDNEKTVLNEKLSQEENATSLNPSISEESSSGLSVSTGTVLFGKYTVVSKLNTTSGEADLYICEYENRKYVAKIYRRKMAVKPSVISNLMSIDSPFVAQIYDSGDYHGYPMEIIPYYKNGSLEGKKFELKTLKNYIIPDLNEALLALHEKGIIHKDLKPSNIMITDSGKAVAIIDFGISSIREGGSTVLVTRTGMTPEYSALETFRNLYLEESDYYSLGITIYELYFGHTPYHGMNGERIEQFISIQKVPIPDSAPEELRDLITGLTYPDITNRKDKSNPNRRWTYEEVVKWCRGEKQPVPGGTSNGNASSKAVILPYTFNHKSYTDIGQLMEALAVNWESGKKQLFRGQLSGFFKNYDPELAGVFLDAEDEVERGKDEDVVFFETIYKAARDVTAFYWKQYHFGSLPDLGSDVLSSVRNNEETKVQEYFEMLKKRVPSDYIQLSQNNYKGILDAIKALEKSVSIYARNTRDMRYYLYLFGYLTSGKKTFFFNGKEFADMDGFTKWLKEEIDSSYEAFKNDCYRLVNKEGVLNTQFEAWLVATGNSDAVTKWKQKYNGR